MTASNSNGDSEPYEFKVSVSDLSIPVITLVGDALIRQTMGEDFSDPGATVEDNVDNDLTAEVSGQVDTSKAGIYVFDLRSN